MSDPSADGNHPVWACMFDPNADEYFEIWQNVRSVFRLKTTVATEVVSCCAYGCGHQTQLDPLAGRHTGATRPGRVRVPFMLRPVASPSGPLVPWSPAMSDPVYTQMRAISGTLIEIHTKMAQIWSTRKCRNRAILDRTSVRARGGPASGGGASTTSYSVSSHLVALPSQSGSRYV